MLQPGQTANVRSPPQMRRCGSAVNGPIADMTASWNIQAMRNPISRYRAYLAQKALPLDGLALSMEAKTQLLPWFGLLLMPIVVCKATGAVESVFNWLLGLTAVISLVGASMVLWEFILIPIRDDYRGARNSRDRE